jgi:YHS domain-containing protein
MQVFCHIQETRASAGNEGALAPQEATMEKDPVCGMNIDPAKAAGSSNYEGKTIFFCNPGCKRKFDANPSQYTR